MKYSPFKIAFYICIVLGILYVFTFFSKSIQLENAKIEDGFKFGKWFVKYPKTATFLTQKVEDPNLIKSVDSILDNVKVVEEEQPIQEKIIPDFSKIDTSKIERIYYPENKNEFLKLLKSNLDSPKCRIIHYGDSQIEGDRMSNYIRNRLQGYFGGYGPGFIPIVQAYQQISATVTHSPNWLRFAAFDPTKEKFEHQKYGAFTSISRFTPYYKTVTDSLLQTLEITNATIDISPSKKSYKFLQNFTNVTLHYGEVQAPTSIKVYVDAILIKADSLVADGKYHPFKIQLATTPSNLKIELSSKISPDFYGVTLDGNQGISLDNVAMRGNSGTIFSSLNSENFSKMYQQLQPKVVIFQYGGNTVPYLKDSTQVKNYARYINNHINWVRNKTNNASFIFIGPSDMTTTENGELITYALLPYLNEVLKETCLKNNIAYWSMFDAMGGKNSMKHWVDQKLAGTDYTHFSPSGTKVISELFFLALYLDVMKE